MKYFQIIVFFTLHISNSNSQSCLENGISFFSQSDVDQFTVDFSDCDTIVGDVFIFGSTITNLEALSNIKSIGGNFTITYTEQLINTSDLVSLDEIRGAIIISDNEGLEDITEIANLSFHGTSIDIQNNQNLKSINGFNSYQDINDIKIINNISLDSVQGFNGVKTILFDVRFNLNHNLQIIDGFNGLDSCRTLFLQNNNSLKNISGFESVRIIESQLSIGSNEVLSDIASFNNLRKTKSIQLTDFNTKQFAGFNSLEIVSDDFQLSQSDSIITFICCNNLNYIKRISISANRNLESVEAFNNLNSTQYIHLTLNPKIANFASLSNIQTIDSTLYLGGFEKLKNFNSFSNLNRVKYLNISPSTTDFRPLSIRDISGFRNIDYDYLQSLTITHCPELSICEYKPICDFLKQTNSESNIHDNAEGCNSREEILEACMIVRTQEELFENHLSIYPNPSTGLIYLDTEDDLQFVEYEIFDISGRTVNIGILAGNRIDLTNLGNGMYIVTLYGKDRIYKEKVTIANTR